MNDIGRPEPILTPTFVSYGNRDEDTFIYLISTYGKDNRQLLRRELIGISETNGEILQGKTLLDNICNAFKSLIGVITSHSYGTVLMNDETWWVPPRSASVFESIFPDPGPYVGVDHAMVDVVKGAAIVVVASDNSTATDHHEAHGFHQKEVNMWVETSRPDGLQRRGLVEAVPTRPMPN